MASSVAELKDALKDALERNGGLHKLQAAARAEAYRALSAAEGQDVPRLEPSPETLLVNELIREYLAFNGYRETLSVFLPESGQPLQRVFDRGFLARQLDVSQGANSAQVPLLYALVAARQQRKQDAAPACTGMAPAPQQHAEHSAWALERSPDRQPQQRPAGLPEAHAGAAAAGAVPAHMQQLDSIDPVDW